MSRFISLTGVAVLMAIGVCAQTGNETGDLQASSLPSKSIHITDFTGELRNAGTVDLQWKAENVSEGDYFLVERSRDGSHFETMIAQSVASPSSIYRISDSSPLSGTDYYRIKYLGSSGITVYSKLVQVSMAGGVDFKFYPNPVDKLLIIRTGHTVDVQVMDPLGSVRLEKELQPGLQIINTSSLERGSYIIRIADRESNRVVSEQLVKN
jgi:hypothetical protein